MNPVSGALTDEPVDLAWELGGHVEICKKGWPVFPSVSNEPGLYRLMLNDGSCYIGQAEGLDNRLYGYRRPTQGVIGEYLLHNALIHAQGAKLEIFTKGDLTSKAERQRLEQVAIGYARTRYKKLLNGPRKDVDTLNAMIAFHTAEISRLQKRLTALSEGASND